MSKTVSQYDYSFPLMKDFGTQQTMTFPFPAESTLFLELSRHFKALSKTEKKDKNDNMLK